MVERKAGLGWRPDRPDWRDERYRFYKALAGEMVAPGALPPKAAPQRGEVDRHGVLDQGYTGSCTGHGIGLCAAVERNVKPRSPFFIYYEARRLIGETDVDNGAYIRDAAKVVAGLGAPLFSKWPSLAANLFVDPADKADRDAARRKLFSYHRLSGGQQFRSCLVSGHVFAVGFSCYANLFDSVVEQTGIVPMPAGPDYGGHCVAVIGYDDNFQNSPWAAWARAAGYPSGDIPSQVYECQNSWGAGWGRGGQFVIPAAYLEDENLADDAWTLRGFADPNR